MGLKEELEEKAEECDAPEEYIAVAKEIVDGLSDKEWAAELLKEGADWAETYEDTVEYARASLDLLQDTETATSLLEQGKNLCSSTEDYLKLAAAALELTLEDVSKDIIGAASTKCTKVTDFLELSDHIAKVL
ncbi:MAG: hypothetical protein KAH09_00225, partial [Desulfobacula sp.]|nr:hypothetical protein [Desulfobacula sp.]